MGMSRMRSMCASSVPGTCQHRSFCMRCQTCTYQHCNRNWRHRRLTWSWMGSSCKSCQSNVRCSGTYQLGTCGTTNRTCTCLGCKRMSCDRWTTPYRMDSLGKPWIGGCSMPCTCHWGNPSTSHEKHTRTCLGGKRSKTHQRQRWSQCRTTYTRCSCAR